jgi:hypothetical protein
MHLWLIFINPQALRIRVKAQMKVFVAPTSLIRNIDMNTRNACDSFWNVSNFLKYFVSLCLFRCVHFCFPYHLQYFASKRNKRKNGVSASEQTCFASFHFKPEAKGEPCFEFVKIWNARKSVSYTIWKVLRNVLFRNFWLFQLVVTAILIDFNQMRKSYLMFRVIISSFVQTQAKLSRRKYKCATFHPFLIFYLLNLPCLGFPPKFR